MNSVFCIFQFFLRNVNFKLGRVVISLSLAKRLNTYNERGGGRNVDDQNVDRPKISERRNGLFS